MTTRIAPNRRIIATMSPHEKLNLAHYLSVLKPWSKLQHEHECFFYIADWEALTALDITEPQLEHLRNDMWDMLIGWLAAGINPGSAHLFLQSRIPEQAEFHTILSMLTPLTWLERQPSFKEQQEDLKEQDQLTYGFLGMPLLQAAAILAFKADYVLVAEEDIPHIELAREVARRFNHIYGRDSGFIEKAKMAIEQLGKKQARLYLDLQKRFQEQGDHEALEKAQALIEDQQNISHGDKERLLGYLEGGGKLILSEPDVLLMNDIVDNSNAADNAISPTATFLTNIYLTDNTSEVEEKIRTMPTDPARVRRTDPGTPEKCPVWDLHQIYSDPTTKNWVQQGCRGAGIGCLDCKQPVIKAIEAELQPLREKMAEFGKEMGMVRGIIAEGCDKAREEAKETLEEVRVVAGIEYW